jgi:hypothetical protein
MQFTPLDALVSLARYKVLVARIKNALVEFVDVETPTIPKEIEMTTDNASVVPAPLINPIPVPVPLPVATAPSEAQNILATILKFVPGLIVGAEAAISTPGNGVAKTQAVLATVQQVLPTGDTGTLGAVEAFIPSVVAFYNAFRLFKK